MIIDESYIIENVDEELALAYLLANRIVFLNTLPVTWESREYTTCIYVNASDIFAWACADAECIKCNDGDLPNEIIDLYIQVKQDEKYGYIKWLCFKRNEQPQYPVKKMMIEAGSWDDALEALPSNDYDEACKKLMI